MIKSTVKTGISKETDPVITRQKELRELANEAGIETTMYSEGPLYESIPIMELWTQDLSVNRHYLCGVGKRLKDGSIWERPLTKGILLSLLEAQKTKRFIRFEIWELKKDPILVGFTKWDPRWGEYNVSWWGSPFNQSTYKICSWE